ncbi:MAG: zinc-ribbon domain-containing protein, partial [Stellaceae bacterium]
MIVVCPQCSTRYLVDPRALGADGRRVRCAQCSHTWHHKPPAEALAELETVAPLPSPAPRAERVEPQFDRPPLAEEPEPEHRIQLPALTQPRRRPWVAVGWIVLLALVGFAAGGAVWERDTVIRTWPPSARLYALFGLAVPQPRDVLKVT